MEELNPNAAEGAAQNPQDDNVNGASSDTLTESQVNEIKEKLRTEQNLPFAIGASAVAAIIGGILWGIVTVATQFQIGYMAVAVGFLVGFANRQFGKGIDPVFGVIGGLFALIGCILGNYLSMIGFNQQSLVLTFLPL